MMVVLVFGQLVIYSRERGWRAGVPMHLLLVERGGDLADKGGKETGKCSEGTSACCKVVAKKQHDAPQKTPQTGKPIV